MIKELRSLGDMQECLRSRPYESQNTFRLAFDLFGEQLLCCLGHHAEVIDLERHRLVAQRSYANQEVQAFTYREGFPFAFACRRRHKSIEVLAKRGENLVRQHSLKGHKQSPNLLAISADGELLASFSKQEGVLKLWELQSLTALATFPVEDASAYDRLTFSARHHLLLTSQEAVPLLFDTAQISQQELPLDECPDCQPRFHRDGGSLWFPEAGPVTGPEEMLCRVVDLDSFEVTTEMLSGFLEEHLSWLLEREGVFFLFYREKGIKLPTSTQKALLSPSGQKLVLQDSPDVVYSCRAGRLFSSTKKEWTIHSVIEYLRLDMLSARDATEHLDALDHGELVRWFAVECAMKLALQEAQGSTEAQRELLALCHSFALEQMGDEERENLSPPYDFAALLYPLLRARRAKNAVRGVLQESKLPVWSRLRLLFLCEAWLACGERTPWLLLEGRCPIDEPDGASLIFSGA